MCHFTDILHCLLMLPRPIINRQSHNILTGFKIRCIVNSYIHFSLTLSCLGEARSTCITACVCTITHTLCYLSCWSWYLIFVIACSLWFHLYIGAYSCIKGSSVLPSRPVCYTYRLLLTCTRSTYRLITILTVYENGLGLSWDNPLCLLFILPCSLFASQRF